MGGVGPARIFASYRVGLPLRLKPPLMTHSFLRPVLGALIPLALAACSSLQSSDNFLGLITPYRVEVVQGNVVTKEQAALIKPGMSRSQVRDMLGSPLLTDIFHADRWDYVFTIRRQGAEPQQRNVMVLFQDDKVSKFEAGDLPSERDFINSIDVAKSGRAPVLELTEEQIKALPVPPKPDATLADAAPQGPARSYPPLEPTK